MGDAYEDSCEYNSCKYWTDCWAIPLCSAIVCIAPMPSTTTHPLWPLCMWPSSTILYVTLPPLAYMTIFPLWHKYIFPYRNGSLSLEAEGDTWLDSLEYNSCSFMATFGKLGLIVSQKMGDSFWFPIDGPNDCNTLFIFGKSRGKSIQ
jgi:hypothetical protein